MHKFLLFICFCFFSISQLSAQDFYCRVRINDAQVQISDKSIFRALEKRLQEFMNNTKWTGEVIQTVEKLDMNIEIILTAYDQSSYEYQASAIIQTRRTIYGTNYSSTVFNFNDENFDFKYQEQDLLEFQDGSFLGDISALMGFYAYYSLGLDYDTFGEEAGTQLFNKALQIANLAEQSSGRAGWKPFEKTIRTRYNLIDNVMNERFKPLRKAYYLYHRQGLDQMTKDPIKAKKNIFLALEQVKKVFKIAPNTVMLLVFFEAKSDELVNIFKGGDEIDKPKAITLLSEINVANLNKYEKIRN
jgi:hypothetical protein